MGFRGEAALAADGIEHKLVFDINALILAEDALDTKLTTLLDALNGSVRLGTLRALVWAGLQHLTSPPNLLRAGEIVGEAGIKAASAAVLKALAAAMPKPTEGAKKEEADVDPPKAAGGTGSASTPAGAA